MKTMNEHLFSKNRTKTQNWKQIFSMETHIDTTIWCWDYSFISFFLSQLQLLLTIKEHEKVLYDVYIGGTVAEFLQWLNVFFIWKQ